eukprot:snap_masked-scaffold_13-processed-gene-7.33-mRNA-1 protein AED:1.00 eAED:1.00 QI:0/0/0/0/1/1/2/0/96
MHVCCRTQKEIPIAKSKSLFQAFSASTLSALVTIKQINTSYIRKYISLRISLFSASFMKMCDLYNHYRYVKWEVKIYITETKQHHFVQPQYGSYKF